MKSTTTAACLMISVAASATPAQQATITEIQETRLSHDKQLTQISLTFTDRAEKPRTGGGPRIELITRSASKGEMRLFEVKPTGNPPPDLAALLHRGMSFDGNETRLLQMDKSARVQLGDVSHEFEPAGAYLALQGYPRDSYKIKSRGRKGSSCDVAHLLQSGTFRVVGEDVIDNHPCVEVSSDTDRLFFSSRLGFALFQRDLLDADGSTWLRLTFRDHFEVHPGVWLAKAIRTKKVVDDDIERVRLTELVEYDVVDVPDSLFTLQFEPGTLVADVRHFAPTPEGNLPIVAYDIPADPEDLTSVIDAAVDAKAERLHQPYEFTRSMVLLAVNAGFLCVIGWILYWKRKQRLAGR